MSNDAAAIEPCELVPHCPLCPAGVMTASVHFVGVYVCVCLTCGTTLNVPIEVMRAFQKRIPRGV